mgnify:CR=1 FL=1
MRGADRLISRLQALPSACRTAAEGALSKSADEALARARHLVPVRTGHLRSTLRKKAADHRHQVMASCSYALFVERGTRRMRAQPYLTPAFHQARYLARVTQAFKEVIR